MIRRGRQLTRPVRGGWPLRAALLSALVSCADAGSPTPLPPAATGGTSAGGAGGSAAMGGTGAGGTGAGGTGIGTGGTGGSGTGGIGPGGTGAGGTGTGGTSTGGTSTGGTGAGGAAIDAPATDAATPCPDSTSSGAIVVDGKTCLSWQKQAGPARTNKQAAKYCDDLVEGGHADWRVPAPEELATWPNLVADSNAYITNPIYIPSGATVMDGCSSNSHSCNLTVYNPGSLGCGWQGVGFSGPTVCVRGIARPGSTASNLAATSCDACKVHLTGSPAEFKPADCLPFATAP
jgi:hypothetical protein